MTEQALQDEERINYDLDRYPFDEEDPFIGKALLWRPLGWNKCYFCAMEKETTTCPGCKIVTYCEGNCKDKYLTFIHKPDKCFITGVLHGKLFNKPMLIGTDHEKGNCVFASRDIDIGEQIVNDTAAAAIVFNENIKIENPNYINSGECFRYEGIEDEHVYSCNLLVALLRNNRALMKCGYYRTIVSGLPEERKTVDAMIKNIYQSPDWNKTKLEEDSASGFEAEISIGFGIVKLNTMAISNRSSGKPLLRGFFPTVSLFNHACYPNCDYHCEPNGTVSIFALSNISKGEELTIDYASISALVNPRVRHEVLQVNHGFICICAKCKTGGMPDISGNVNCSSTSIDDIMAVINIAELNNVEKIEQICEIVVKYRSHFTKHVACCIKTLLKLSVVEFSLDITQQTYRNPDLVYEAMTLLQKYANVGLSQMDSKEWQILHIRPALYLTTLCSYIRIKRLAIESETNKSDSGHFKCETNDPLLVLVFYWIVNDLMFYIREIKQISMVCPKKGQLLEKLLFSYLDVAKNEAVAARENK